MEPKSGNSFEQPSVPVEYEAQSPEKTQALPELERSVEVAPLERESTAAGTTPLPTVLPVVSLPAPVPQSQTVTSTDDDDNPSVAADDDLIEKEWVDKAKKVIASTRDDPYKREREVNKLQVDYLKKRYGKALGNDG